MKENEETTTPIVTFAVNDQWPPCATTPITVVNRPLNEFNRPGLVL